MRVFSLLLTLFVILAILSLSQAVGRLLGFGEYLSASSVFVLVIFLAVINVVFVWRLGKTIVAVGKNGTISLIIFYIIVVATTGITLAYRSYTSTPAFLIESISITVSVKDVEGTAGHIEGVSQLKVLKGGLDRILWGNLGSTGVIKNVAVRNLNPEHKYEVAERGGDWLVSLLFPNRLRKGEQINFGLEFDVEGSEPGGDIYWANPVTFPTQNLQMTIIVPKGRPCKSADARSEDAKIIGAGRRDEPPPLLSDDNTRLTWAKADPEEGRTYIVTCH